MARRRRAHRRSVQKVRRLSFLAHITTANREIVTFIEGRISDRATRKEYGDVAGLDGLLLILHCRSMNEKYSVEFGSTAESYLRSHIKKGIGAPTTAAVNSFYSYINIYVSCLPPSRVDHESVQANWLFDAACELGDEIRADVRMNVKLAACSGSLARTKENRYSWLWGSRNRASFAKRSTGGARPLAPYSPRGATTPRPNNATDATDAPDATGFEERIIKALEARMDPRRSRKGNGKRKSESEQDADYKKFKAAKEQFAA